MTSPDAFVGRVTPALRDIVASVLPGFRLRSVVPLDPDSASSDETRKAAGYGIPLRLEVEAPGGARRTLVFHAAGANAFGHDRRADRAAEMILGFDTFNDIPRHVRALDVGAIGLRGGLVSLRDAGEFYLLTEYAEGHVYAEDLRRIASRGSVEAADLARCDALVQCLVELHRVPRGGAEVYRRSVRDLTGGGEGIAGLIDGYPDGVPAAPLARLVRLQEACVRQRFRLRHFEHRCRRIHGDFHPFNVLFGEGPAPILLDASRGSEGEPADDATCMAINYVFFAIEHPGAFRGAFSKLWDRFWAGYLQQTGDDAILDAAPAYFAWRGLVVANPAWYPAVTEKARDTLLSLVEAVLRADRLDPRAVAEAVA
jgi:hypothetical protein